MFYVIPHRSFATEKLSPQSGSTTGTRFANGAPSYQLWVETVQQILVQNVDKQTFSFWQGLGRKRMVCFWLLDRESGHQVGER